MAFSFALGGYFDNTTALSVRWNVVQAYPDELDRDLVEPLKENAAGPGELIVHNADALSFDFCGLGESEQLSVIGNLPYNISTPLLFALVGYRARIEDMHFMLQKEVVDRMAAGPGIDDWMGANLF